MPEINSPFNSPVLMFMAYDVMERLLNSSDDIDELSELVTSELRELTGARKVCLFQATGVSPETEPELLHFSPARSAQLWQSEAVQILVREVPRLQQTTLWLMRNADSPVQEALEDLDAEISLAIPLRSGNTYVGGALLIGISSLHNFDKMLGMFSPLEKIVTLLLQNASLIERQEIIIQARTRDLLLTEQQYKTVIDTLPIGLLVIEPGGIICEVNPAAEKMYGVDHEELCGRPVSSLFHEKSIKSMQLYCELVEKGRAVRFDAIQSRKDGELITVDIRACPMDSEHSPKWLMICSDISEQMRLEEQIRQSEKLNAIGRLAGGVAHDFNNQLMGILGFSELLAEELEGHSLKEYVDRIIDSAQHSGELTGQLLAFARKGQQAREPIHVHKMLDDVCAILTHSIDPRIQIRKDFQAIDPVVEGNTSQLQNAILNIALNARDAILENGEVQFQTRCRSIVDNTTGASELQREFVDIVISDDGVGMDNHVKSRLFEPFFTTKPIGQGTGMGMAAVYGTVQNLKGKIEIESEPEVGTTVRVCLPLLREIIPVPDSCSDVPSASACGILVVDDEPNVCDSIAQYLELRDFLVFTCRSGREAIRLYREKQHQISLVILDMVMPELSGTETYYALREMNPDVKILLLSGYTVDEQIRALLEVDMCEFIQKPLSLHKLLDTITVLLNPETVR